MKIEFIQGVMAGMALLAAIVGLIKIFKDHSYDERKDFSWPPPPPKKQSDILSFSPPRIPPFPPPRHFENDVRIPHVKQSDREKLPL